MRQKKKMTEFEKIYFSPPHPAAYAGANRLQHALRKLYRPDKVNEWLEGQDAYNLHTYVKRKFPRRFYNVRNVDDVWEADLMDMRSLRTYNDDYTYLLVIIDVLSKYAWLEPLKDKTGKSVAQGIERILKRSKKRVPVLLQSDKGKEFLCRETLAVLKKNNIEHRVVRNPDIKAAVVERFIRTIKERVWRYFTHHGTRRYMGVIKSILESYNNSIHSATKMTPASIDLHNAAIARRNLERRYDRCLPRKLKYKIGDLVRTSRANNAFEKGYEGGWTLELFKIYRISEVRHPAVYYSKDLADEPIEGFFYEEELSRVRKDLTTSAFEVEEILDTRGRGRNKKYLVSWKGYPDKFNSWEPATAIDCSQK